jgi:hypothetical protein
MIPLRRFRFALVLLAALLAVVTSARSQALTPAGAAALHAIADSARNPDLRWPDFSPMKTEFSAFYQSNEYSPAWIQGHKPTPQALAVIGLLKGAEDYDASRWDARLAKLSQSPTEQDLVLFDTALTVSAMRYIQAVHVGRESDIQPISARIFARTSANSAGDIAPFRLARLFRQSRLFT